MRLFTSFLYTVLQLALGLILAALCIGLLAFMVKYPALFLLVPAVAVFGIAWNDNYRDER